MSAKKSTEIRLPKGSRLRIIRCESRKTEDGQYEYRALCECSCGVVKWMDKFNVVYGKATSCGCRRKESTTKHGMAKTRIHTAWKGMIRRCEEPSCSSFENYGGRGIAVFGVWRDFWCFYEYMKTLGLDENGDIPKGLQIDRRDNDKGYEPGNVRLVIVPVNMRNTRNNRVIEINGVSKCVTEWSEEFGIRPCVVFARIYRGWDEADAVTTPLNERKPICRSKKVNPDPRFRTTSAR